MIRSFLTVLACFFLLVIVSAQVRDDNAFAGKRAIFIYHGLPPASPASPDASGSTGYIIQRKEKNAGSWVTIDSAHFPQSAAELSDRYKAAKLLLSNANMLFDAPDAWKRWNKYHSFDSLRSAVAYPTGQMAFGFLLADTSVVKDKIYQYRILKNNQVIPAGDELSSNAVAFPAKVNVPSPKYLKRQTEPDAIRLQWAVRGSSHIPGFIVYRQGGTEKNFVPVNVTSSYLKRNDSLIYLIIDDKIVMSEAYRYYITPVNGFGGGGNIMSDTIAATGMDPTKLLTPQYIKTADDVAHKAIRISYLLADPGYIGSVQLFRSERYDDGYEEVGANNGTDTLFTDHRIVPGKKYYYYLLMTDKLGRNGTRSIKTVGLFQDTVNTFPARFVEAAATRAGIIIKWNAPPDSASLSGFYVCRNDGEGNGFKRIASLIPYTGKNEYTFIDTASTLKAGTQYAYSVVTENLSNAVSRISNIAYVSPISGAHMNNAMSTPRNVKVITDQKGARLTWYDMRLINTTQAYYRIYRKSATDKDYSVLSDHYPVSLIGFTDSTIVAGNTYQYAIEAFDAAGNGSGKTTTSTVDPKAIANALPRLTAYNARNGISISWANAVTNNNPDDYIIYKYTRGQNPLKIATVKPDTTSFTDQDVVANKTYYYFIGISPDPLINKSNTVVISKQ